MFYLKLASQNIRKSLSIFAPFMLASLFLFTILSSLFQLQFSSVMKTLDTAAIVIGLGSFVMTIFSLIVEIYSFNFLMKQRSREFGLYNMLGMNKKKVAWILTLELVLVFFGMVVIGSIFSAIFSNVLYLLFVHITHYQDLYFSVSPLALLLSGLVFAGIFFILELIAVVTIGKTNALILFKSAQKGEKEPKGNIFLAALGCVALAMGYYISITSKSMDAAIIGEFFFAVLLVIAGTYLFYISFMTWYLKRRRNNKNYFYKPENFITTSQMIFRMKQHATGLASITLLAVMSFVAIATTTSLYTGVNVKVETLYPKESSIRIYAENRAESEVLWQETVASHFPEQTADAIKYLSYGGLFFAENDTLELADKTYVVTENSTRAVFITQDDFRALGNDFKPLSDKQVMYVYPKYTSPLKTVKMGDVSFEAMAYGKEDFVYPDILNAYMPVLIIVPNEETLMTIRDFYVANEGFKDLSYNILADLSDEEVASLGNSENNGPIRLEVADAEYPVGSIMQKTVFMNQLYGFTGGFLFTGFLLGLSFLLGAALIIYYKQYSEGFEDKKSYKILQEVGMSKENVRKTINSQTLILFFMPLAMSILHFVMSLFMLKSMLYMLGVESTNLIFLVSGVTVLIVCVLYYLVYRLTSRVYYRIIKR